MRVVQSWYYNIPHTNIIYIFTGKFRTYKHINLSFIIELYSIASKWVRAAKKKKHKYHCDIFFMSHISYNINTSFLLLKINTVTVIPSLTCVHDEREPHTPSHGLLWCVDAATAVAFALYLYIILFSCMNIIK